MLRTTGRQILLAGLFVCLATTVPASTYAATTGAPAAIVSGTAGKPLRLKLTPPADKPDVAWNIILVNGLPETLALSKGTKLGNGTWSLTPADLDAVLILSPRAYEVAVDLDIVFLTGDRSTKERTSIKLLLWASNAEDPASTTGEQPAVADSSDITSSIAVMQTTSAPDDTSNTDNNNEDAQLLFAQQLLSAGRVASARSLFEPLAVGGNAKAARAMAETFDPKALRNMKIVRVKADIGKARLWYAKAKDLGDTEAASRLKALPAKAN